MHTATGTTDVHVHNSYTDSPCKHADITDATHTCKDRGQKQTHTPTHKIDTRNKCKRYTRKINTETNTNTHSQDKKKQTQNLSQNKYRNKNKTSRKIKTRQET